MAPAVVFLVFTLAAAIGFATLWSTRPLHSPEAIRIRARYTLLISAAAIGCAVALALVTSR